MAQSLQDISRDHLDTEEHIRRLEEIARSLGSGKVSKNEALELKNKLIDAATQVRDASYLNKDNPEIKELDGLTRKIAEAREVKDGTLKAFLTNFSKWKATRDSNFNQRLKEKEEELSKEEKDKSDKAKKDKQDKEKSRKAEEEEKNKAQEDARKKEEEEAEEKKKKEAEEAEEDELDEDDDEEKDEEVAERGETTKQAPRTASVKTSEKSLESAPAVAAAATAVAATTATKSVSARSTGDAQTNNPNLSQTVQVSGTAAGSSSSGSGGVTVSVTAETESAAASAERPKVNVTATATTEPVSGNKLERAAAARNISVEAGAAAGVGVSVAVSAAFSSGATQAAEWLEQHQALNPEQLQVQALQDIGARTARETEAAFTGRGQVAQARAENLGFARGLSAGLTQKAQGTGNQSWTQVAQTINRSANEIQTRSQRLETPGTNSETFDFSPEESQALEQAYTEFAPEMPSLDAGLAQPKAATEKMVGAGIVPPKRSGKARTKTPLATGQTIQTPITQLPYSVPESNKAASRGESILGPDYSNTEDRESPLEEGAHFPTGAMAHGEDVGPPIYASDEDETEKFAGGGPLNDIEAAQRFASETQQSRRNLAQFIPAMGGMIPMINGMQQEDEQDEGDEYGDGGEEDEENEEENETGRDNTQPSKDNKNPIEKAKDLEEDINKARKTIDKLKNGGKNATKTLEKGVEKGVQKGGEVAAKGVGRTASVGAEATEVAAAPETVLLSLILLVAQLNLQLLLKYLVMKPMGALQEHTGMDEMAGDTAKKGMGFMKDFASQSFAEDVLTIFVDCMLMANFCFMPPQCTCTFIIIILLVLVGGVVGFENMTSAFDALK